ncbi:serine/threonine-protein kinase [Streptomyces exfoliatus]|uniref:Serine/threonine-protein kinase n=1 Tax=Streptomyces exfoliatus TaxID=1905 RepID=A0ABV3D7J3_STREX
MLAIKVIRPELAQDPAFRDRFRREVAAARRVSGAFTAPVVDADAEGASPWLATLFVPGPSLAECVAGQGSLPVAEVRQLAVGLAEALRDIHRAGLVHRDLKPGNVLLAADGPRVIDFGIARTAGATQLTQTGAAIGTPPFMAPEQFRDGTVGPAADVFAFGAVLVYAATGHGPFDGDTAHSIGFRVVYEEPDLTGLAEELRPLVTACLAKEPADRPGPEWLLENLAGSMPLLPRPAQPDPRIYVSVPPAAPTLALGPSAGNPSDDALSPTWSASPAPTQRPLPELSRRKSLAITAAALAVVTAVTVPLVVSQLKERDQGTGRGQLGSPLSPSPALSSCAASPNTLRGSGSSTQEKAIAGWIAGYRQLCPDEEVVYEGSGVGAGLMDFSMQKDTGFALLNEPMNASQATWARKRCGDAGALQIPVTTMPVAVVFHLKGVGMLVLDAGAVAGVFSGRITQWNDPSIARLNRTTSLPDTKIRVFHHRGLSQTTLILTHYLAGAAPDAWPYRAKEAMPVKTGEGLLEDDIARQLAETDGSISYLPLAVAQANKLPMAHVDTGGEEPVLPGSESLAKGAEGARRLSPSGTDLAMDIDHGMRASGAYPVFRFGYAVACAPAQAVPGPNALMFLRYVLSGEAQLSAERNGYGRLPSKLRGDVLKALDDE